ncbi:MAG: polyphosphate polymerase domain-containing protein [Bacteroidaceae bacterium]|nr:polyphosphate polymerase domain-containing protein [Paraprevotella sp.]MDY3891989.1 polyphosphate polymerase domain-containing protein [Bacteroidaceae bacterium]MDD7098517.1 polyphosphate polymerase domain-containing protein [Paraprevotella sp.]MDY4615305.1 polyphosphate polymerase domain-containing protein [Bacteroidaceae bacterium]MDY4786902.1 polyphosphate polymerase domain-containing protein [Bacteroidaceae bacterium]
METDNRIYQLLSRLEPITLEQMSGIRLMNRTDTKFVTSKEKLIQLLEMAQGKYYAQSIDGNRIARYMTTYWDTDDHLFYHEHHNGHSPRQKVRVRTYMDTDITFLEVKTKNNHGRTKKKRVEVPCQKISAENGNEEFLQGLVHKGLDDMHPTVRNQFRRITLVNYGKTERLTIDFDVHFLNEETGLQAETGNLVIIELKRDGNVYSPVLDILRELRIKPSGFSKYCIGSVMTNSKLKRNTFKPRLVDLRKLSGAALQMA